MPFSCIYWAIYLFLFRQFRSSIEDCWYILYMLNIWRFSVLYQKSSGSKTISKAYFLHFLLWMTFSRFSRFLPGLGILWWIFVAIARDTHHAFCMFYCTWGNTCLILNLHYVFHIYRLKKIFKVKKIPPYIIILSRVMSNQSLMISKSENNIWF